jgi:hypothetical protein
VLRGVLTAMAVAVIWGLASATSTTAAPSCWQQLVQDWADGRIAGTYSVSCYRRALSRMPEDLQIYSSAPDDIEAALQRRVRQAGARSLAASTASRSTQSSRGWLDTRRALGLAAGLTLAYAAVLAMAARKARRL